MLNQNPSKMKKSTFYFSLLPVIMLFAFVVRLNAQTPDYLHDPLQDFNLIETHSDDSVPDNYDGLLITGDGNSEGAWDPDGYRLKRTTTDTQYVVWKVNDITHFEAVFHSFHYNKDPDHVSFFVSQDDINYTEITTFDLTKEGGGVWQWASFTITADIASDNYQYLKMIVAGEWAGDKDFTPQLGDMYINFDTTEYTAGADNNWETSGNWSNGVPTSSTALTIIKADEEVTINSNVTVNKLYVDSGATLTIDAAGSLTVEDELILKSPHDNGPAGQLIDHGTLTMNGEFKMERYLPTNSTSYNWRYLSLPVDAANASVFDITESSEKYIFHWDEAADSWQEITTGATSLSPMTGYSYAFPNDTMMELTGTPNSGSLSVSSLDRTSGNSFEGFHLIGNPYPSAIDIDELTSSNLTQDVWVRSAGSFTTYNWASGIGANGGSDTISAMQSFWIRVQDGTTGSLTFENAMRIGGKSIMLKSADAEKDNEIRVKLESSGLKTDETVIAFFEDAENGFEIFDSEKMFSKDPKYPQIFSIVDERELAINSYNALINGQLTVKIGMRLLPSSNYKLKIDELPQLDEETSVFLIDNEKDTETQLYEGQVIAIQNQSGKLVKDRFELSIQSNDTKEQLGSVTSIASASQASEMNVYTANDLLYLNPESALSGLTHVEVYDLLGRKIYDHQFNGLSGKQAISLNSKSQCFIVRISTGNNTITKKIMK